MKLVSLIIIGLSAGLALNSSAGNITGTVRAEGKAGAQSSSVDGKYDSRKFKFVERVNYDELRDFVVYIDGAIAGLTNSPKTLSVDTRRVNQKGAVFIPHVLPIMAGTTVEWPNNDDIFHNVFSMSESNPFDLDLYKNPTVKKWTFKNPGRVDVFCSIHANMNCVVLVLQNPYFTLVPQAGRFAITNVPPGTYKLKAWHERLPALTQEIVVSDSGDTKVDLVLGIKNLPKQ
jgi:plastocyanin